MMEQRAFCQDLIKRLQERGADKVVVIFNRSESSEFNLIYKELNLLRSMESIRLTLYAYKDDKRAIKSFNQIDEASVEAAIKEIMQSVKESNPDPAFDIAPYQEAKSFVDGSLVPDNDLIVRRLTDFATEMKRDFSCVSFDATLSHTHSKTAFMNSNGVDFLMERGYYEFMTMFTAKIDGKMSSMNYTYFEAADLEQDLMEINQTRMMIAQITQQTQPGSIPAKFVGDVILAPMVLGGLISTLISQQFGDGALISKLSRFPDHLGQKLLSEKLTVTNRPTDPRMAMKYFLTSDGLLAKEAAVIENGVLKHYPISIYAANKTGKKLTIGDAGNLVIEGGQHSLEEMIASTQEGILCMRASYGNPSPQGDMSSVVKNSYYIKDGAIAGPVSETMISFNLIEAMNSIEDFSRETHLLGSMIMPYMRFSGATVSKKD